MARSIEFPVEAARELRLRKGYTQTDISSRLNCSAATISAIENGKATKRAFVDYILTLAVAPMARKRSPGGDLRAGRQKAK